MFKTIATAAFAAAALATAAMPITSAEARSRRGDAALFGAALVGGTLLGAALATPRQRIAYEDHVVVRRCKTRVKLVGFDEWDEPVYRKVRICR
jgi:hypothetical protein